MYSQISLPRNFRLCNRRPLAILRKVAPPLMPARTKSASKDSTANLGFEAKLWLAADKLRNNMDVFVSSPFQSISVERITQKWRS